MQLSSIRYRNKYEDNEYEKLNYENENDIYFENKSLHIFLKNHEEIVTLSSKTYSARIHKK